MVRAAGIDPGTKSMDICALENGKVYYEESINTSKVAEKPEMIVNSTEEAFPLSLIAGPSGYGVELTSIREIQQEIFEDWYYNYILLTRRKEIEDAVKKNVFGALVYYAMTKSALVMKSRGWPVIYIPAVVHLPTVSEFRKINKMDMGTADKMCAAVLGVHDQSRELGIPYSKVSFILVEMGFGYNAVIGVQKGRIVDGIGGTTISGLGFLTAGCLDSELVQIVGGWEKADVFKGGVASITGEIDPEEFVKRVGTSERCKLSWEAMMESINKAVCSMKVSVRQPREILISGRLVRIKKIREELIGILSKHAPVREFGLLDGAKITKETAQGYGIVAEGIAGGKFKKLVEWMKIKEARGTALDNIYHPKFGSVRKEFVPFKKARSEDH
jgi:predicted butyrate kinase (DUF1464 family)